MLVMRLGLLLLSMLFGLCTIAALPPSTNLVLPATQYDLAEVVFRDCMKADFKGVYHLGYGTNNAPLPADFMARFAKQTPVVRTAPDEITVVSNKIVLDKITHKEAICLGLHEIRVTGDTAEVHVMFFLSRTSNSSLIHLVRDRAKWKVKDRQAEWVADTF